MKPSSLQDGFYIIIIFALFKNHIMAKNTIEHDGIVTQVADTFIIVTIQNQTACAGCRQRSLRHVGNDLEEHHGGKTK